MIFKIYSSNDLLADILHKNPGTDEGLYLKPLKSGTIVGNIISSRQYDVMFWDKGKSYTDNTSNQLDYQSMCNPLLLLHSCTELFGHVLKDKPEYEKQKMSWLNMTRGEADVANCSIVVPVFYVNSTWYRNGVFLLEKYFEGVQLEHKVGYNFILKVTGSTIFEALNLLNLVALFVHLTNNDSLNTFIDSNFTSKYLRVLTNIEGVPYFVLYLFIKKALKNTAQFDLVKPVLEDYLARSGIQAELCHEDTQRSRIRFITEAVGNDTAIVDVGCGEFSYYKRLMKGGFTGNYYAVDQDHSVLRLGESIARSYDADNLYCYDHLSNIFPREPVNVIMSEVIEHNEPEVALELVKSVLKFDFVKVVISTPNASFNQYYFDSGFRHADHHFEFSRPAFESFIASCTAGNEYLQFTYHQVGDQLNGQGPTQIVIIEQIDKN